MYICTVSYPDSHFVSKQPQRQRHVTNYSATSQSTRATWKIDVDTPRILVNNNRSDWII